MATTTTDSYFFWYIRLGPQVNTIGIVDEDGLAVDSGLTVELRGELSDDTQDFSNDATFLLREEYLMKFVSGCINEYLETIHGKSDPVLLTKFEEGKAAMRRLLRTQKYSGDFIKPKNMRSDRYRYTPVRSENV